MNTVASVVADFQDDIYSAFHKVQSTPDCSAKIAALDELSKIYKKWNPPKNLRASLYGDNYNLDTAIPQSFYDMCNKNNFDPWGQFVWCYDKKGMGNFPGPLTIEAEVFCKTMKIETAHRKPHPLFGDFAEQAK